MSEWRRRYSANNALSARYIGRCHREKDPPAKDPSLRSSDVPGREYTAYNSSNPAKLNFVRIEVDKMTDREANSGHHDAKLDFSSDMSYGDYLGLDALLDAQHPQSGAYDEMLFIIQHQTSE